MYTQMEFDFNVFTEEIKDGKYLIKVVNQFFEEDWFPIHFIEVMNGIVITQQVVHQGSFVDVPHMVGYTVNQLSEWLSYEPCSDCSMTANLMEKL